jgi:hypothetical protein
VTATTANSHDFRDPQGANLVRRMAVIAARAWGLAFLAVALLLLGRRWSGALLVPLSLLQCLTVGCLVGAMGPVVRLAVRRPGPTRRFDLLPSACYTAAIAAFGGSLTLPGTPTVGIAAMLGLLTAGEIIGWWLLLRRPSRRRSIPSPVDSQASPRMVTEPSELARPRRRAGAAEDGSEDPVSEDPAEDDRDLLADDVWQQITRAESDQGGELVFGVVRCEFAEGQRQTRIHIAFCPPLARRPELSAEQVDGPPVRIKTSMLETFGVCLEVKRGAPGNEPITAQIQFFASAPRPDAASDHSIAKPVAG